MCPGLLRRKKTWHLPPCSGRVSETPDKLPCHAALDSTMSGVLKTILLTVCPTTCGYAFTVYLQPHLVCTVDLPVDVPDAPYIQGDNVITFGPLAPEFRVTLSCGVSPVTRSGHLQHFAIGLTFCSWRDSFDLWRLINPRGRSACSKVQTQGPSLLGIHGPGDTKY